MLPRGHFSSKTLRAPITSSQRWPETESRLVPIVGPVSASLINIPCPSLLQRNHFQNVPRHASGTCCPIFPPSTFPWAPQKFSQVPWHNGGASPRESPLRHILNLHVVSGEQSPLGTAAGGWGAAPGWRGRGTETQEDKKHSKLK